MTVVLDASLSAPASLRANILFRRTYARPLDEDGTIFETYEQAIDRVVGHQRWLWEQALGDSLLVDQELELEELRQLMLARKVMVSGRVLWLGGTEVIKRRGASAFNCAYADVRTVHDVVDVFWLLLQGTGVGFRPINGALSGFTRRMAVEVIRSTRQKADGNTENTESYDPQAKVWTIQVGDSAEAWAKAIGKIVAGKYPAAKLVVDLSPIRPPGSRLKGYGWICQGDALLAQAIEAIYAIMNRRVGKLLTKMDILDIINWLGTVLSNRRSAQIALVDADDPEIGDFVTRKYKGFDACADWYRGQSNNTVVHERRPIKKQLREFFDLMVENGGSEPAFANAAAARRRTPWWRGMNPCGEILLPDMGFCNLVDIGINKFKGDDRGLHRAAYLIARANYRQTLVNLRDGVLQDAWHQQNEYLRLCGIGLTGIAQRPDMTPYDYQQVRNSAVSGAYSIADELGLERPKAVTTIKPSGTLSKAIFDSSEGAHKPKGRYLFNTISFSKYDPMIPQLIEAGYQVRDHPHDAGSRLVVVPVEYPDVPLHTRNGYELDCESAVDQLNRYRALMRDYVDHNVSITVSYTPSEIPKIVDTMYDHWDEYVSCSFLFRDDPTKTAEDLGYAYMPQRVVTPEEYHAYNETIRPLSLDDDHGFDGVDAGVECEGGACPVK